MTEDEPRTPALLLSSKTNHWSGMSPLLRIELRVVYVTATGSIRNGSTSSFDTDPYADLVIGAQYDGATTERQPYGWEVEYRDVYSANLRRVEAMVKTLRKVERGLEKLRAEWGYPDSFAAYVVRVGKLLGTSEFGYKAAGNDSSYDSNEYRWTDADGLRYRIQALVAEHDKNATPA
jgi:hypothetical protein